MPKIIKKILKWLLKAVDIDITHDDGVFRIQVSLGGFVLIDKTLNVDLDK